MARRNRRNNAVPQRTAEIQGRTHYVPVFLCIILLSGILLRVLYLTWAPPGLNQDEASSGYEAWAILHYGVDRNGNSLPVLLESWGSGQNALYSYIAMPFVGVLGLSVFSTRLPAAILGSVALILAFLLGKRIRDEKFALLLTLVVALNPWHLSISRWALESNVLPFMILLAMLGAVMWDGGKARYTHILTAAALGLSLYAYGSAFIWTPLFALGIAVRKLILAKTARVKALKQVGVALVVFAAIAFPIALCNLRNILGLPSMKLLWFTLPKLTETRQASVMSLNVAEHVKQLASILWTQSDGLPWNSVPVFGLFYGKIGLLFVVFGLITAIISKRGAIPLIALSAAVVTALFIEININRVNVLFIPMLYFQAEALYFIACKLKRAAPLVPAVIAIAGIFMCTKYFTDYRTRLAPYFESRDNMPYIYVLFDEKVSPKEFSDSVRYMNPDGAFRWVDEFNWRTEAGEWRTYTR